MTYSWNWVEKHKRRQRRRKWLAMLSPLVVIGLLLYLFSGKPFFHRLPTASDQPNAEGETNLSDEDMASTNISKGSSTLPPLPAVDKFEDDSPSQASPRVRPANDSAKDQQRMIAAQQALAKIHKKIDRESERLKKFGGNAWLQMQSLLDAASVAGSPAKLVSLVDQASHLLEATLPEIDIAELLATMRSDNPVDAIEKLIEFRKRYPDHPRLSELGNVVAEVGHKGWLKWAASEMEACSPDSAACFGSSPESVGRIVGICETLRTDLGSSSTTAGPPSLTPPLSPRILS